MIKIQQFWILKFNSERLKQAKYNIDITLDEARINSEVISINNSEMIRALFRLKNISFSQEKINNLLKTKLKIKKLENNADNRKKISEIDNEIEKFLFLEDFISIEFENKTHYKSIIKRKGFYVNGIRYTPFMASAGMIRKNTALFINNNYKHQLMDVLENGRNEYEKVVPAKLGAYFSLYSSTTLLVSFPSFAVIPDKEIESIKKVDFVTYKGENEDDDVVEKDMLIKSNAFDGQGLISPSLAKKWSEELELDYTFSTAVIRASFLKGMVVTFDFIKFAEEVAKTFIFKDIYGIERDIRDIELIVSESMFKLWSSYPSTEDYIEKCKKNKLDFSIAKVNPKEDKVSSKTSYQYLQVLNMNEVEVAKFCEPTVDWIRNISGGSAESMILYATGEHEFDIKYFEKLDVATKAVMINPLLSRDRYIQNKFIKTIDKKKKESYMGSLLINANYSIMISDPYYQACHIFNLDESPLLQDSQHYSKLWLSKGINQVIAVRSPIVHHSEVNTLNLQNNEKTQYWYSHIQSGIIFPANGIGMDCAIHGGSDFDGDLVCTINNAIMQGGIIKGLPILYESQKAEKKIVDLRDDFEQAEGQLAGYNSKVGFATNISSSLYCLLEEFEKSSLEHETILKRLKIGRVIQGEIIDGVKGLKIPPFRHHWTKWKKVTEDMSEEEKKKQTFYNSILCEIRPSFFRFLYSDYMTKYNAELKKYNIYSHMKFKKDFSELFLSKNRTEEEEELIKKYKWNSFFLENNSTVNKISRYMRTTLNLVNKYSNKISKEFDYSVLLNNKIRFDSNKLEKMKIYVNKYKMFKQGSWVEGEDTTDNIDSFMAYLKKECNNNTSSNEAELAHYAVLTTYGDDIGRVDFSWKMFPNGMIDNIKNNSNKTVKIPVRDDNGEIEYLWKKYSIKEYPLEDLYENE